ncbi:MAG: holo-ACP synthase [Sphaerochaetaceae bacterium]|jgi:holo-[acyl-carrier protein] synthase|nr:holo-ACP synthase [Sphaerochaetaceae bacterium]MDD3942236.1 holo-ACP synthase [Sphaerochaetaceae bacterium]MDX9938349.1 holo-ACP synthase [Sphaerochaetaceae bacterium]
MEMGIRGIGVDAVAIERMDAQRMRAHAVARLFHGTEVEHANALTTNRAEFLASRFAAKEALVKALGCGFRGIFPAEIAVVTNEKGRPEFLLPERVIKEFSLDRSTIHLSLTHEGPLALAFVIVEDRHGSF